MYLNFVDFSKAFDSLIREKVWVILRQYGLPDLFVNIIKELYSGSESCVLDGKRTSEWFKVKSGVKQGCVMSGFIFIIVVDWVMRNTNNTKRGLRWKFSSVLEDLEYADDIALLSSRFCDMQDKTDQLDRNASAVGLSINTMKTKTMRMNCKWVEPVKIRDVDVEDVDTFTYLGAVLNKHGGAKEDISRRLALARGAFASLRPLWRSSKYSTKTKLKIFNSNVIAVLLYGAEMWRLTSVDAERLNIFHRKGLRRILGVFWPNRMSNNDLYSKTGTTQISQEVTLRRWRWLGHILRRDANSNVRVALSWTPEGRRKRGRPRETWRRSIDKERVKIGITSWTNAERMAGDRSGWRQMLDGLKRPPGREEDE